jgi:very-short-patch-repair endonuclease
VERQHGVVARRQLVALGLGRRAIEHRIARGRLRPVHAGVYAVGRPTLTQLGRWMAAVLACGDGAALTHGSAAALWGIGVERGEIEVAVPSAAPRHPRGVRVRRRPALLSSSLRTHRSIPVTDPIQTLVDLASRLGPKSVERAVNEADRLDLVNPPRLRRALVHHRGERGVARLRHLLDHRTFRLTREELERRFLPLARRAGLPVPLTKQIVNKFEVDFFWPDLGFVVETDGLRYHRTPAEQARDRLRDQAHTAAGLTQLRFTHEQVRYEPDHVLQVLSETACRIAERGTASAPTVGLRSA